MSQLESEMKSAMNLCHQQAKKLLIFSQESGDPIFFSVAELGLDQQQQLRILTMPPQVCGYSA